MYRKIMVPLDGSTGAECVLPHLQEIATGCGNKEIVLLRVVEPERMYKGSDSAIDSNVAATREAERSRNARRYLVKVADRLEASGLTCTVKTLVGRVAESLVDYCASAGVDLIVIATHGRSGVTRWVMGSVADKILRSSQTPVMMVRTPGNAGTL